MQEATPTDNENEETPDYYSNASDELSILQPSRTALKVYIKINDYATLTNVRI